MSAAGGPYRMRMTYAAGEGYHNELVTIELVVVDAVNFFHAQLLSERELRKYPWGTWVLKGAVVEMEVKAVTT